MGAEIKVEKIELRAGGSTSFGSVRCRLYIDPTSINDVTGGGAEVDLGSFTLPANVLQNVEDSLHLIIRGNFGSSSLSRTIKVYFAGTLLGSFGSSVASTVFDIDVILVVTDATVSDSTVTAFFTEYHVGSSISGGMQRTDVTGLDLTTTKILKATSTTTSTGVTPYTTEWLFLCDFIPAP